MRGARPSHTSNARLLVPAFAAFAGALALAGAGAVLMRQGRVNHDRATRDEVRRVLHRERQLLAIEGRLTAVEAGHRASALPHTLVRDDRGIATWRPVLTTLSVHGVAQDHNARHLVVREDGVERFRFKLDGDQAAHIADLLCPATAQPERAA